MLRSLDAALVHTELTLTLPLLEKQLGLNCVVPAVGGAPQFTTSVVVTAAERIPSLRPSER